MFVFSQMVFVSVAHRYWNSLWSSERNRKVYGSLASAEGLGSNLRLVLAAKTHTTQVPEIGLALERLKSLTDHCCLFTDRDEFAQVPSTLENITLWMARCIPGLNEGQWFWLDVYETERLFCRYEFESGRVILGQKIGNLHLSIQGDVDEASGILLPRDCAASAVRDVFPAFSQPEADTSEWLQRLFCELSKKVPGLCELAVDLGRQKTLRIVPTGQ